MIQTSLVVQKISVEDLLKHEDQEYNPAIWKTQVERYATFPKIQFYIIPKDGKIFSYNRFYASYVADGIYFFNRFSPFCASITNNGFCKVHIAEDGTVSKSEFSDGKGKTGYAANTKENRAMFRKDLTTRDIMVSNCI